MRRIGFSTGSHGRSIISCACRPVASYVLGRLYSVCTAAASASAIAAYSGASGNGVVTIASAGGSHFSGVPVGGSGVIGIAIISGTA